MGTLLLASAGATEAVAAAAMTAMLPSRKMRRPALLLCVSDPRHVIGVKRKAEVKSITKNMVKSFIVECNNWELVVRITIVKHGDEPDIKVL